MAEAINPSLEAIPAVAKNWSHQDVPITNQSFLFDGFLTSCWSRPWFWRSEIKTMRVEFYESPWNPSGWISAFQWNRCHLSIWLTNWRSNIFQDFQSLNLHQFVPSNAKKTENHQWFHGEYFCIPSRNWTWFAVKSAVYTWCSHWKPSISWGISQCCVWLPEDIPHVSFIWMFMD